MKTNPFEVFDKNVKIEEVETDAPVKETETPSEEVETEVENVMQTIESTEIEEYEEV